MFKSIRIQFQLNFVVVSFTFIFYRSWFWWFYICWGVLLRFRAILIRWVSWGDTNFTCSRRSFSMIILWHDWYRMGIALIDFMRYSMGTTPFSFSILTYFNFILHDDFIFWTSTIYLVVGCDNYFLLHYTFNLWDVIYFYKGFQILFVVVSLKITLMSFSRWKILHRGVFLAKVNQERLMNFTIMIQIRKHLIQFKNIYGIPAILPD